MTAILSPRTKKRTLSPFEASLNRENLLVELDRIMPCDEFDDDRLHEQILSEMPDLAEFERQRKKGKSLKNDNMPPEIVVLYNNPVLTREQEHHLFRKYNFLKHQAQQLLQRKHGLVVQMEVRRLLQQAVVLKQHIADCNIRLAVSVSRKHAQITDQMHRLWEIVSEANWCILKSIVCFDFTRRVKFSTYTTWGIRNNLGRASAEHREHHSRYSSGHDPKVFERAAPEQKLTEETDRQLFLKKTVDSMLLRLEPRDSAILRMYMLDEGLSLDAVGKKFGITKERVRQIKVSSIKKMRDMVEKGDVTLNGFLQEFVKE
jgi:RNA polymerase sigma factor (sigma-70 family)